MTILTDTRTIPRRTLARWRTWRGQCWVSGKRECPWHPDGGNHPDAGAR